MMPPAAYGPVNANINVLVHALVNVLGLGLLRQSVEWIRQNNVCEWFVIGIRNERNSAPFIGFALICLANLATLRRSTRLESYFLK